MAIKLCSINVFSSYTTQFNASDIHSKTTGKVNFTLLNQW